jgi:hypothetical protein
LCLREAKDDGKDTERYMEPNMSAPEKQYS